MNFADQEGLPEVLVQSQQSSTPAGGSIHLFKCNADLPQPTKAKVNDIGEYVRWEGCTIVMALHPQHAVAADHYFSRLQSDPMVTDHIALLPSASYHVTLRGIQNRTKYENGEQYNAYIDDHMLSLEELDQHFSDEFSDPNVLISMVADFDASSEGSRGGQTIYFSHAKEHQQKLRDLEIYCCEKIPNISKSKQQQWHLTLGYMYKKPKNKGTSQALVSCLRGYMSEFLSECDGTLSFERPRVCWYNDMTCFHPL